MNFTLVGNRNNKAVICWPVLFFTSVAVLIVSILGALAFSLITGWFSLQAFVLIVFGVTIFIGTVIKRSLQKPLQDLPVLS
ncbi:MAG: hypothetical protein JKX85_10955 [Phycisphaeraceae bacterium]|nr:hypothetical protein [Phycisphaeraceae bacterium]